MGLILEGQLIDELSERYPEFTRKTIKDLVGYGMRKLVHQLNTGNEVFINGDTFSKNYDGVLFCKDVAYKSHIEKMKVDKLKRLNRNRVNKFNKKDNGREE